MNWQSVSFDWNQARAFLATVEEGSLSAAARALNLTQPTLGRQVAALEEDLGVVLFERIGRSLTLTPSGLELLDHAKAMRDAAVHFSLTATGQSQLVEGKVRITASDVMAAFLLPPVLEKIRAAAPLLEIDIVASNDIRDLQRREADIAIRHVRPEQPDLIAKRLTEATAHCYASTRYIEKYGQPQSPANLKDHHFIGLGDNSQMIEYLRPLGLDISTQNLRLGSESMIVAWEMARNGLGIIVMSDNVANLSSEMVRILPDMAPITFPVWLTTHRELHTSRRIRITFDLLAEFFA